MNNIVELVTTTDLTVEENVTALESTLLRTEQAECPVVHHFGPGVYIREVTIPAGTFAIGHAHKQPHLNIMLKGKLLLVGDGGRLEELEAPVIRTTPAGRKVAYILEDVVWQNIYATEETDIDKLEDMFLDKSENWTEYNEKAEDLNRAFHQEDRDDFDKVCDEIQMSQEEVRAVSENEADQIPMPEGYSNLVVRDSCIEGKGIFTTFPIKKGQIIGPARIGNYRTPVGRHTNHSVRPNARAVVIGNTAYFEALQDIDGCRGGDKGEEITVDYRQVVAVSQSMRSNEL
jgi:hypothetical protein